MSDTVTKLNVYEEAALKRLLANPVSRHQSILSDLDTAEKMHVMDAFKVEAERIEKSAGSAGEQAVSQRVVYAPQFH